MDKKLPTHSELQLKALLRVLLQFRLAHNVRVMLAGSYLVCFQIAGSHQGISVEEFWSCAHQSCKGNVWHASMKECATAQRLKESLYTISHGIWTISAVKRPFEASQL